MPLTPKELRHQAHSYRIYWDLLLFCSWWKSQLLSIWGHAPQFRKLGVICCALEIKLLKNTAGFQWPNYRILGSLKVVPSESTDMCVDGCMATCLVTHPFITLETYLSWDILCARLYDGTPTVVWLSWHFFRLVSRTLWYASLVSGTGDPNDRVAANFAEKLRMCVRRAYGTSS